MDSSVNNGPLVYEGIDSGHEHPMLPHPQNASLQQLPSYLLPSILSYVPVPHLQYRLVNKEWNNSMNNVHSLGNCNECEVHCSSAGELFTEMQELTRPGDSQQKQTPWPLHWKINQHSDSLVASGLTHLQNHVIPFLDSLDCACCYTITLAITDKSVRQPVASTLAEWCLHHSKPTKYTFFLSPQPIRFETGQDISSFLRAPSMLHVSRFIFNAHLTMPEVDGRQDLLSPLHDSDTVSKLKSLFFEDCYFLSQDAKYLAESPHLTNLTYLCFYNLDGLDGMTGEDRTSSFDTIICSPIMNNVKSCALSHIRGYLGYALTEAFAQSKHLKNLTRLELDGVRDSDDQWLEPLLHCDATMPNLRSLSLQEMFQVPKAVMNVLSSPSSALFNRIETLDLSFSTISPKSMETFFTSGGLKSLKRLMLARASLTDGLLELLTSARVPRFANLEYLDLDMNFRVTNQSVIGLCSTQNFPKLQHIIFTRCEKITAAVLKEICELPPRPNLRILSFKNLFRMDAGAKRQIQEDVNLVAPELKLEL